MFILHERIDAETAPSNSRSAFGYRDFIELDTSPRSRLEVRIAKLGEVDLHVVKSTGHRIGLSIEDRTTVLLPQVGTISAKTRDTQSAARPGELLVLNPGTRVTSVKPGRDGLFVGRVVVLPTALTAGRTEWQSASMRTTRHPGVRKLLPLSGDEAARALVTYLSYLFEEGQTTASPFQMANVRRAAGALVKELLVPVVTPDDDPLENSPGSRCAEMLVNAAEEIMEARSSDPVTIGEIAASVGVGPRALQHAFREKRDRTPRQVLAGFRMTRARARLLCPGPGETVTEIALDCGFTHLSRFAGDYRVRFGEHPSETLSRGRLTMGH